MGALSVDLPGSEKSIATGTTAPPRVHPRDERDPPRRLGGSLQIPCITPTSDAPRRPPAGVRLKRINANYSKPYPPDGRDKEWWDRLKKALGTSSSHFVNATLLQL